MRRTTARPGIDAGFVIREAKQGVLGSDLKQIIER
jgi:hypothetical protein